MKLLTSDMDPDEMKAWRRRRAFTVEQAAEELGISRRAIMRYEAGESTIPITIAKLCEALDELVRLRKKIKSL